MYCIIVVAYRKIVITNIAYDVNNCCKVSVCIALLSNCRLALRVIYLKMLQEFSETSCYTDVHWLSYLYYDWLKDSLSLLLYVTCFILKCYTFGWCSSMEPDVDT